MHCIVYLERRFNFMVHKKLKGLHGIMYLANNINTLLYFTEPNNSHPPTPTIMFYLFELLFTYACAGIIMHMFSCQQRQIVALQKTMHRYELELEERDEQRADWEDNVNQGLDAVIAVVHMMRKLRKRVMKLETANVDENLDIIDENVKKLRDVLDTSVNNLQAQFAETQDSVTGLTHLLNKMQIVAHGIPERQLSPDIVFTENGLPVYIGDHAYLPVNPNDIEETYSPEIEYFDH